LKWPSNYNIIQSYLTAIDNKNKEKMKDLYNKRNEHNIENDIVSEIYKRNKLNSKRLQFIIDNCTCLF